MHIINVYAYLKVPELAKKENPRGLVDPNDLVSYKG